MSETPGNGQENRPRISARTSRNTITTKSGKTIKLHQNLSERVRARRDAAARRKAARLVGLPKSRFKRILFHLHPKRVIRYWFSREGALMALKITGISIIAGFLLLAGIFAYFRKDLPNFNDISGNNIGGSIRYYDRSGQTLIWEDYDAAKRIPVKDEDIAQYMKDATVAVEDKDFFKHGGFDVKGITRAVVKDVTGGGAKEGGSTITQQLVKLNNDWSNEKTITRKIKELILAVELERTYSKQKILAGYLNLAPYGNVQYGVEAASQDYFNKSAKDLTLAESAFLASIPKSPAYYSPYGAYFKEDPETATADTKARMNYVLDIMFEQGMITGGQRDEAKNTDVLATVKLPKPKYDNIKAPYFVLTAKEQLIAKYGAKLVKSGGWKVTTTVDLNAQQIAEEQLQKGMTQVNRQKGNVAAFVAEDVKTGQVVALVGNDAFDAGQDKGQVNYARQKLAPGSSIKPYSYTALIENSTDVGAGTVLYDTQGPLPDYPCTNKSQPKTDGTGGNCLWDYDRRYPGPLTLRYALGASRNVPAAKAMLTVGVSKVQETYKKMAGTSWNLEDPNDMGDRGDYKCYDNVQKTSEIGCSTASGIGDGAYLKLDEHVHGFATLSRNGVNLPQTYILKIEDSTGKTIEEWQPSKGTEAVRPDSAYIVSDMLADPNASYFTRKPHKYKDWKFSLKTGTTNDQKDGWLLGFSTQYAAGVWVGNTNNTEMTGGMENMTQPIWSGWMQKMHDGKKAEDRAKPSGVQSLPAYVIRSHVEYGTVEPSPTNDLYPSWYKANKTGAAQQTIDIVSNKLATDCTPTRARKDTTSANKFAADKFVTGGQSGNLTEKDDVHKCDDVKPSVTINSIDKNSVTVTVTAGTHPLSSDAFPGTLSVVIDGQTVQSASVSDADSGSPKTLSYTYSGTGSKEVQVVVVDSVLYDAADSKPVDFGSGVAASISLSASRSGNSVNFSWTGGTASYDVYYKKSSDPDSAYTKACNNQGGNSCSKGGLSGGTTYSSYIQDSSGAKSNVVGF